MNNSESRFDFLDIVGLGSAGLGIYNTILNQKQLSNDELYLKLEKEIKENNRILREIYNILKGEKGTMYKEMIKTALDKNSGEIEEVIENMFEELKVKEPKKYWDMYFDLYEANYGHKLNEEMAKEWVKEMKPYGEHWTKEQTDDVLDSKGLTLDPVEFYAVMNNIYNDDNTAIDLIPDEDLRLRVYVNLANNFIKDPDFGPNKTYNYRKMIILNKLEE